MHSGTDGEDDLSTVLLVLRAEVIADGCFPAIEHKASLFCIYFPFFKKINKTSNANVCPVRCPLCGSLLLI